MCQPKAPSPTSTIAAQTASNKETAIAQAGLNAVNQVTPNGNLTYTQNGTWPDGTPKYTATTTLSAAQQQLLDTGQGTSQNLANLAKEQSGRLSGLLAEPIDFNSQKDYLDNLTSGALDKSWGQDSASLASSLANKGIKEGSDAYTRALSDFSSNKSAAYNAANVSNYNTALQSQMALRQAPINEILALAGQTGVQGPQFASTPQTGVAGTDVAGITQQGYANANNGYNQTQSQLGGLFGTLGNIGSAFLTLSDKRAKENIRKVGETKDGQNIYEYNYKGSDKTEMGLIAQEVMEDHPEAVQKIGGLFHVDYGRALEGAV